MLKKILYTVSIFSLVASLVILIVAAQTQNDFLGTSAKQATTAVITFSIILGVIWIYFRSLRIEEEADEQIAEVLKELKQQVVEPKTAIEVAEFFPPLNFNAQKEDIITKLEERADKLRVNADIVHKIVSSAKRFDNFLSTYMESDENFQQNHEYWFGKYFWQWHANDTHGTTPYQRKLNIFGDNVNDKELVLNHTRVAISMLKNKYLQTQKA